MIELELAAPEPEEYCSLRVASGLSPKDEHAAAEALPRSLFAVSARDDGQLVGMARVVGDGLHVQVVDVAVLPDYQGQGISRSMLERVMQYIASLPTSTSVSLFADVDWLYQKFGFAPPGASQGMFLVDWPTRPTTNP